MQEFIAKYQEQIAGVLTGFDRLIFRGTLRGITYVGGMQRYLARNGVLLKSFGAHVEQVSERLKEASTAQARGLGRPIRYLASSQVDKEDVARQIAARDGIGQGLVCVLSCVEPCWSFEIYRNRDTRQIDLVRRYRKCLFLYHYSIHPRWGWMNARIQTWFPFAIQICLNGREWLARQMDAAGLAYVRQDNCFPWIADWRAAQKLVDQQLQTCWPQELGAVAAVLNPLHDEIFHNYPVPYYWSTYQSEWASDMVFPKADDLRRLFPRLLHHSLTSFSSQDVMRFLGRRIPLNGEVPQRFQGQVVTDVERRREGVRIKHSVNGNSLKLYDKAYTPLGSVLRAETTVHNADDFRVFRTGEGDSEGKKSWRRMRRGIADLHRRTVVSQKANERYLDALASVNDNTTLAELLQRWQQPRRWHGRRVRALRPFASEDRALLQAVNRGEFILNGVRNRQLQPLFFSQPAPTLPEARRRSAWVSRKLRLLRAHSVIRKIAGTHRYQVTPAGRRAISAVLTALSSTIRQLVPEAA